MSKSNDDMLDSCFTQFKFDYSGTASLAIGDAIIRDVSGGGLRWRIDCFPRGNRAEDKGEVVSVSLELTGGGSHGVVRAIFEAFVMRPSDGAPSTSRAHRCLQVHRPHPPDQPQPGLTAQAHRAGIRELVKRSDLQRLYLADGWATITCGVIVMRDDDPLDVPPPDIGSHLGLLLDSAEGSDVSFLVDGEKFPAHRAVLAARSPVFKEQLLCYTTTTAAKAKMSSVTLHDIAPATFKALLRFVYTDAFPADAELGGGIDDDDDSSPAPAPLEMFRRLLAAADRFALDRLKLVCARKLWDRVSADTVAATLQCAEAYSCPELKTKCVAFLADEKHFRNAVLTDGFVQLVHKFPSIIAELKEAGK